MEAYCASVHLYRAVVSAIEQKSGPAMSQAGTSVDGVAFLEANAQQPDVHQLPCGLQYRVRHQTPGTQVPSPKLGTECEVHFRGMLVGSETEFDSSDRSGQPARLTPRSASIRGWTIALQLMGEGDRWTVFVPPALAYGDAGWRDERSSCAIPPGAVVMYELELVRVVGASKVRPRRPADPPVEGTFTPAAFFQGGLPGYVFATREQGTGYCTLPG